jgi:AcrR family transcriptional regulator
MLETVILGNGAPDSAGRNPTSLAIREAALRLFAERGYANTTMKGLADQVGIRPSGIYNHVESKQALLG